MDESRFFISAPEPYGCLATASAPFIVDLRRQPAFEADGTAIAGAIRRLPDQATTWRSERSSARPLADARAAQGRPVRLPMVRAPVHRSRSRVRAGADGAALRGRSVVMRRGLGTALLASFLAMTAQGGAQGGEMVRLDLTTVDLSPLGGEFLMGLTGDGPAGDWKVMADGTAAHGKAIAQLSTDRTDYRFPLAVYKPISAKDVDVQLRFKPVSGNVDQAGGIAVRLTSFDNYYVVRANAAEDNVRFYRVVKGKREQLESTNVKVASNRWHELGLRAEGDRFTVTYDGKTLFTAMDKTFANDGKVALWTKADSVTYFDRIEIRTLP
jgi:hypothetical protein